MDDRPSAPKVRMNQNSMPFDTVTRRDLYQARGRGKGNSLSFQVQLGRQALGGAESRQVQARSG